MIRIFLFGVLALVATLVVGAGFVYFSAPQRYNVLIVGSDQRGTEASRSDVLMVFSISKSKTGGVNLLTIPRDSRVEVEGHGMQKITHAYGYDKKSGETMGNVDLTRQTVEDSLNIPIHATVEFTFQSFIDFIDSVGGVKVGGKTLDGEEALVLVRDRDRAGGDFARAEEQRGILKALLPLVTTVDGAKEAYSFFNSNAESRINFDKWDLGQFAFAYVLGNRSIKPPTGGIEDFVVPGAGDRIYTEEFGKELYYWVPNPEELNTLTEEHFK